MSQAFQARRLRDGHFVAYRHNAAVVQGQVIVVGSNSLVLVAEHAYGANELGSYAIWGDFEIVKVNGTIGAWSAIYWDAAGNPQGGTAGTGCATTESSGNTFLGFAPEAVASATAETVRVIKVPAISVTNTIHLALSNAITDPGDQGAIAVTDSGTCPLVTATAETRTLAAPTYAGQMLQIRMKTDGGNATITCATLFDGTYNTAVFGDVGDTLILVAGEEGSNLRWRVVVNVGVALSTV